MTYDRVLRPRPFKFIRKALKTEVSRAFGLWIAAALVCLMMSFAWMSMHYDPDRAAMAGKHAIADPAIGEQQP